MPPPKYAPFLCRSPRRSLDERNALALANAGLLHRVLARAFPAGARSADARRVGGWDDLVQEGFLFLLLAAEQYDATRLKPDGSPHAFSTYACRCLQLQFRRLRSRAGLIPVPTAVFRASNRPEVRAAAARAQAVCSLEALGRARSHGPGDGTLPYDASDTRRDPETGGDDAELLAAALRGAHPGDRELLEAYYLHGRTYADIGAGRGLSKERIRQLLMRALFRARHAAGLGGPETCRRCGGAYPVRDMVWVGGSTGAGFGPRCPGCLPAGRRQSPAA